MARAKPKFSTYDVQRAISGAEKAGQVIARCDIRPDGTISLVTTHGAQLDAQQSKPDESELNPLERWRARRDARQNAKARQ